MDLKIIEFFIYGGEERGAVVEQLEGAAYQSSIKPEIHSGLVL